MCTTTGFSGLGQERLNSAFSGIFWHNYIIATMGKTTHLIFNVPLDVNETSVCSISKQSELEELIRETSFIIWDEAPMTHCDMLEDN